MGKPEPKETEVVLTKGTLTLRDDMDNPRQSWLIAREGKRAGAEAFLSLTPERARFLATVLRTWADEHSQG